MSTPFVAESDGRRPTHPYPLGFFRPPNYHCDDLSAFASFVGSVFDGARPVLYGPSFLDPQAFIDKPIRHERYSCVQASSLLQGNLVSVLRIRVFKSLR